MGKRVAWNGAGAYRKAARNNGGGALYPSLSLRIAVSPSLSLCLRLGVIE